MKLRVLVADDHPVVRSGIVAMLSREPDLVVVGEACDGEEAVRLSQDLSPDVVVMDLRMPNRDGASATEAVVSGGAQVLVLTSYDLGADIEAALGAGAVGCLTKDADRSEIVEAVRATARGERSLSGNGWALTGGLPSLVPARMRGSRRRRQGPVESRNRARVVHCRSHREDASAACFRQAGCGRSHAGGPRGHRTRNAAGSVRSDAVLVRGQGGPL